MSRTGNWIIIIIIIITRTMFMVLSSWHSHCESSPGSFDECRLSAGWPPTLRPNQKTSKSTGVENRSHIYHFWPPASTIKFKEATGEMHESVLRVQPRIKPPIYFWRNSARPSRRLQHGCRQKFSSMLESLRHTSGRGVNSSTSVGRVDSWR